MSIVDRPSVADRSTVGGPRLTTPVPDDHWAASETEWVDNPFPDSPVPDFPPAPAEPVPVGGSIGQSPNDASGLSRHARRERVQPPTTLA